MAAKARDNWKQTGFTNMAGQQSPDVRQPLNTPAPYDAYTPRTTAPTAFVFPSKTCSGYLLLAIPKSAKNVADPPIAPDYPIPGGKLGPISPDLRAQLCGCGNNLPALDLQKRHKLAENLGISHSLWREAFSIVLHRKTVRPKRRNVNHGCNFAMITLPAFFQKHQSQGSHEDQFPLRDC